MNKTEIKTQNPMLQLLTEAYGGRIIAFHSGLAKALGSNNAALFLQQCLYWSSKTKDLEEGWFYKSIKEFEEELNMTKREQMGVIKILKKYNLIETKRKGSGALRYIRVNIDGFWNFLCQTKK